MNECAPHCVSLVGKMFLLFYCHVIQKNRCPGRVFFFEPHGHSFNWFLMIAFVCLTVLGNGDVLQISIKPICCSLFDDLVCLPFQSFFSFHRKLTVVSGLRLSVWRGHFMCFLFLERNFLIYFITTCFCVLILNTLTKLSSSIKAFLSSMLSGSKIHMRKCHIYGNLYWR